MDMPFFFNRSQIYLYFYTMTSDLHPAHPFESIQGSRHISGQFQIIQIIIGPSIY